MAHKTLEQADALAYLIDEYGEPFRLDIEHTSDPYGIIRASFGMGNILGTGTPTRNFFIRPNGERLTWDSL